MITLLDYFISPFQKTIFGDNEIMVTVDSFRKEFLRVVVYLDTPPKEDYTYELMALEGEK